jgi:hypothetical protein
LRWRKDGNAIGEYSGGRMSALMPTPATTVDEVFKKIPEASRVFIRHHTNLQELKGMNLRTLIFFDLL